MSDRQKHLEMIQGVINRFSKNSLVLLERMECYPNFLPCLLCLLILCNVNLVYFACIPITILWGLDAFFLWQEQLYRKLYDDCTETSRR